MIDGMSPEMHAIWQRAVDDATRERNNPDPEKLRRERARLHRWVQRTARTASL